MEERKAPNGPMYVGLASQATRAGVEKGETGCGGWPKVQMDLADGPKCSESL